MSKSEEKNIEKIIYHYCSVEIFISIIENQELWASDIFKMNDSSEEKYLEDLLRFYLKRIHGELLKDKKFKEYLDKKGKNDKESTKKERENTEKLKKELFKEYYNKIFSAPIKKNIDSYIKINKFLTINDLLKEKSKKIKRYIFCFSGDGDLLSQWRAYADDGKGISIGFKKSGIKEFLKGIEFETIDIEHKEKIRKILKKIEVDLFDIEYIKKVKESSYNKELCKIFKYFPKIEVIMGGTGFNEMIIDSLLFDPKMEIYSDLSPFLRYFTFMITKRYLSDEELKPQIMKRLKNFIKVKSSTFSEEKESRIVIIEDETGENQDINNIHFRSKNNNELVSYKKLKLENIVDFISHIVLGPKNKITVEELKRFLIKQFSEEKIKHIVIEKSNIPYV